MSPRKAAEPLEMPFGCGLRWAQGTIMLDGGVDALTVYCIRHMTCVCTNSCLLGVAV